MTGPATDPDPPEEDFRARVERERRERLALPRTLAVHLSLRVHVSALPELLADLGLSTGSERPYTIVGLQAGELEEVRSA